MDEEAFAIGVPGNLKHVFSRCEYRKGVRKSRKENYPL
jgi:hypothetical protein